MQAQLVVTSKGITSKFGRTRCASNSVSWKHCASGPSAKKDPATEPGSQSKPSFRERLQGKRVLVVEDELFISMELEMSLEDCGAEVVGPFPSVEEVLEVSTDLTADVAILDVNLNGIMVFPVADLLLEKKIPFVFHTGNAGTESLSELYPGVSVVKKPADMPELLERATELI